MAETALVNLIRLLNSSVEPLSVQDDFASLLKKIGDAHFVLIGEATHGTYEFYQTRAEITKRLILQKGFSAVAIEGDWTRVYRIQRYLQGVGHRNNWEESLRAFNRFPTWMWRNNTMPPFLLWLRAYNESLNKPNKIGLFGMDLYSMYEAIQAVISYLSKVDPEAAKRATNRYQCFDDVITDPQQYGYLTTQGVISGCVKEATEQLQEMREKTLVTLKQDDFYLQDEYFYALQNARLVKDAEEYYRAIFTNHVNSWNIRDRHMAETIQALYLYLAKRGYENPKIVIWAHNSHVGDARATEMSDRGELNLGQLLREKYNQDMYNIGFSTYQGTVTAADNWDAPAKRKVVLPGCKGSYEELFHHLDFPNFLLDLHQDELEYYLKLPRLQRAIGVIYHPETERESHYFFTHLPFQFDTIIHLDHTTAVQPI